MTQVLIDRATLEQLVGALEGVRLCTPPAQRPMVREAITAGRAALANAEPIGWQAIEAWNTRTALAQQELPQKARPDFMAGYDAGMADAKRMAQQGDPEVLAHDNCRAESICRIWCGNSACISHTAAPAPQAQEPPHVWMIQGSHGTWKGEHAEMDAKAEAKRCGGTCYAYPLYTHPEPMRILTDAERAVREKARDK